MSRIAAAAPSTGDMTGEVDLSAPAAVADPYPVYAELRRSAPVCRLKGGGFLLTRHADVAAALADPGLRNGPSRFSVLHPNKAGRYQSAKLANNILPFQDAPLHTERRRLVQKAFAPSARATIAALPAIAEAELIRTLEAGAAEIVADFGRPFSVAAMGRFFGFTDAQAEELAPGTDAFFRLFTPVTDAAIFQAGETALAHTRAAFRDAIDRQTRDDPESFGARLHHMAGPDGLDWIADTALLLFADGVENIQYAIGAALAFLHDCPGLVDDLAAGRADLHRAVDEFLRLHTPAQSIPRIADQEIVLHGVTIRRDTPVHLSLASANRDETVFAEADRFHPDRPDRTAAIPFGAGRHSCIGGTLGQRMVIAALDALIARGVTPTVRFADLDFMPRFGHRWPVAVPVHVR